MGVVSQYGTCVGVVFMDRHNATKILFSAMFVVSVYFRVVSWWYFLWSLRFLSGALMVWPYRVQRDDGFESSPCFLSTFCFIPGDVCGSWLFVATWFLRSTVIAWSFNPGDVCGSCLGPILELYFRRCLRLFPAMVAVIWADGCGYLRRWLRLFPPMFAVPVWHKEAVVDVGDIIAR